LGEWIYVVHGAAVQYPSGQRMNESMADILRIIVDGGTVVYVGYKSGRWELKNREKLTPRRMIPVRKDLHLPWRVEAPARRVVELSGTVKAGASMSGELSVTYPQEIPSAWEELLWWYLRVR
jgi:hypothetical protein